MGLVVKSTFASGEIDPRLWERTTLDKYKNGLATARNVIISKTGSVVSRPGRSLYVQTKFLNEPVVGYSPPGSGLLLEWGNLYVRVYSLTTNQLIGDIAQPFLASDIPNMNFETSGSYVYVFVSGKNVIKFNYVTGIFLPALSIFAVPPAPTSAIITSTGGPTGNAIQYAFTYIFNGEESGYLESLGNSVLLPESVGQMNTLSAILAPAIGTFGNYSNPLVTAMNVYRRPYLGGAYGFIGNAAGSDLTINGSGQIVGNFVDIGQNADYSTSPPQSIVLGTPETETGNPDPGAILLSRTGIVYQQRLLITDAVKDLEAIYASQPGFQDNFMQDFPTDAASALKFKAGTSGYAQVLRMLDSTNGLAVFTTAGIYLNSGPIGPSNLALAKQGNWIINPSVPPLSVPGGAMFLDLSTNSVRNLTWQFQTNSYGADEVSIYSDHLFRTREVSTWHFQLGVFPLLYVVFNDGTYASFTFMFEQDLRAWTRHDSDAVLTVRSSVGTINPDQSFFVVSKLDSSGNTVRYFEQTVPRYPTANQIATNPEYYLDQWIAYMDSIVSFSNLLNQGLKGSDLFTIKPTLEWTDPNTNQPQLAWDQSVNGTQNVLVLGCGTSAIFTPGNAAGIGVGTILRFFDQDGCAFDLTIIDVIDNNNVEVTFEESKFPHWDFTPLIDGTGVSGGRFYQAVTTVSGLSHLEGEYPAVIADGAVVCSPNNDIDNYPAVQVINGQLTLPNGLFGAYIHVGRPVVGDTATLAIDTVEQAPTLIESIQVDKVYVKYFQSQGLFIGNSFPTQQGNKVNNGVKGMQPIDEYVVDYRQHHTIIGNRAAQPQTRRAEITMKGDWGSQGQICLRQVDPLHFEILSIIPDVEVLTRSDR